MSHRLVIMRSSPRRARAVTFELHFVKPRVALPKPVALPRCIAAISDDGAIEFTLIRRPGGVHVERSEVRPGKGRLIHSMQFQDDDSFVRWCEADRLRLAYPLLFADLQRSAHVLFDPIP